MIKNNTQIINKGFESMRESEALYRGILNASPDGIAITDLEGQILMVSTAALKIMNCDQEQKLVGRSIHEFIEPRDLERASANIVRLFQGTMTGPGDYRGLRFDGSIYDMEVNADLIRDIEGQATQMIFIVRDITVRKSTQEAIRNRILALTQPFEGGTISFEELFNINDIQRIQDEFALATNVASIITKPDGVPLTSPSNFTYLCSEIIRKNEKGFSNCFKSDAELGRFHPEGPIIQQCLSCGLWDAGTSITVGNHHVANWLIGQVRDGTQDEEKMVEYAREIGADETAFMEAFHKVPAMSHSQFKKVAQALFTIANQLSTAAYQNLQQARFITERQRAEKSFKENERLLEEAQAVANLGSYVWNIPNGLWKSSRILDNIFGIDDKYIRSLEGWINIVHPDWQEIMADYVKNEVLENHQQFDKEYKIIRKNDGQELWVHGVGQLELDNNNQPYKLIGTISDITYRKKSEEEIQRLNEELEHRVILRTRQLEAANKELEAFSYSVSHDLRAPVRHILGFSEILKNECSEQLTEDARHYLETISSSAQKMGVLIDDLLRFSRTGRAEISESSFNMNKIVDDALSQLRHTISGRQIDWQISSMPDVIGDYNLLRQVWINLFNNAIKYTSTRENSVIRVGYKDESSDELIFFVYDNGVGFDMKFAHKLFGVFQRLHSPTQFEGTGIGLANVRRIISRHGGRTWAKAEVDRGATFYFSLPKSGIGNRG
jgi:PAS domain S-box-containing protein